MLTWEDGEIMIWVSYNLYSSDILWTKHEWLTNIPTFCHCRDVCLCRKTWICQNDNGEWMGKPNFISTPISICSWMLMTFDFILNYQRNLFISLENICFYLDKDLYEDVSIFMQSLSWTSIKTFYRKKSLFSFLSSSFAHVILQK